MAATRTTTLHALHQLTSSPQSLRSSQRLPSHLTHYPLRLSNPTRNYSVTSSPSALTGIAPLLSRSLIKLAGRDAPKFLQGLTTNNVDAGRALGWYTAFLTAQGRVITDAFVWPLLRAEEDWACLLDVDESIAPLLLSHLKKHKLRSKVKIATVQGSRVWAGWLSEQPSGLPQYRAPNLEGDGLARGAWGYQSDPRLLNFSHRFIASEEDGTDTLGSKLPESFAALDQVTQREYDERRFLNGIPEGPKEMFTEHFQAHPSDLDALNAVDFHKGCYVGQELTIRTEHTGVVRKRIIPVRLYSSSVPTAISSQPSFDDSAIDSTSIPHEAKITAVGGKRETGRWVAGVGNIGLAMCRLETMTDMKVSAEGGSYKEGDEFVLPLEGGTEYKVKAFVPEWLTERLRARRRLRE